MEKFKNPLCFIGIGLSIGIIIAFSESPVIAAVLSTLLVVVFIFAALLSGVKDIRLLPWYKGDSRANISVDTANSFSAVLLVAFTVSLTAGVLFGKFIKNKCFKVDLTEAATNWEKVLSFNASAHAEIDRQLISDTVNYSNKLAKIKCDSLIALKHNLDLKRKIGLALFEYYYNTTIADKYVKTRASEPYGELRNDNKEHSEDTNELKLLGLLSSMNNLEGKSALSSNPQPLIPMIESSVKSGAFKNRTLKEECMQLSLLSNSLMRIKSESSQFKFVRELSNSISNDSILKSAYQNVWKNL